MRLKVTRSKPLRGELRPPSDKSLTHRAFMFAAIAIGQSTVRNPLRAHDTDATLRCLAQMGLKFSWTSENEIALNPAREWTQPKAELDCGNSGTTMRLLSGLIASRPVSATLIGDESLSKRPMGRIAKPLKLMGAKVEGETPPLRIQGGNLKAIDYASPVASAQVKSCVLLAGLRAKGETRVSESVRSRDHTERMLKALGVPVETSFLAGGSYRAGVKGGAAPRSFEFDVPGDISSAAFLLVAAAMIPASDVTLRNIGVNPTRTGILDVFRQAGIDVRVENQKDELGEPVADLLIRGADSGRPFQIDGELVPRLVDEIPVLAVLATRLDGVSTIRGASELRVKESDRIAKIAEGLTAMGAKVEIREDGLDIEGPTSLRGASIDSSGDHRIAMAFAIAGLVADGETVIDGAESIATSYPGFEGDLKRLQM